MKIGIISDTHGFLDKAIFNYFEQVDMLWHAGDIGSMDVLNSLAKFKPTTFVYGNIDAKDVQLACSEYIVFKCEQLRIAMVHIAGKPGIYSPSTRQRLATDTPDIVVCGHSHMVMAKTFITPCKHVYLNPGAAGNEGFHKIRTIMRMEVLENKITKLEVIELGKRGLSG